ncbi:autophagy-related protein 13 homolog isoform X2 [Ceratina calcarata]|uniref:Autophagy-related protein 13 n=1 Tax=Ceratina calcarata TaxID=156304 RepID=A0AAJ7RX33_9HYME|nr:autophagy-related protein 13 homolog isoform X2 [Ceratina calcarata]
MSTLKVSIQDKKDLDKFTKFLAYKAAQIIVQSRSGEKVNTNCKPNSSGTDWFNLAIHEVPDVLADAKKVLCGELINSTISLCIEISLRTIEGDTMVLETWSLGVLPEHSDPTVRVTYTVYNRMGVLLKSLLSVSRVTPAYKLSRRQSPDSYVICYRIYMGEPQLHTLGDNYKHVRVGQLCTPVGTIHLAVSYRTKMAISPSHTDRDSIMLKSDHFHSDLSPRHARYQQSEDIAKSLNEPMKNVAFAPNPVIIKEEDYLIPDIPLGPLFSKKKSTPTVSMSETTNTKTATTTATLASTSSTATATAMATTTDSSNGNNERFANDNATSKCNSQNESRRSSYSMTSANNDFIMNPPFATTTPTSELYDFYRECQNAPPLQGSMEERTVAEQIGGDLTQVLETFEADLHRTEERPTSLKDTSERGRSTSLTDTSGL